MTEEITTTAAPEVRPVTDPVVEPADPVVEPRLRGSLAELARLGGRWGAKPGRHLALSDLSPEESLPATRSWTAPPSSPAIPACCP
jgi:hypothetical protein